MRTITTRVAIALLALAAATAAAQEFMPMPAQVLCKDGRLVGLRVLVPEAGVITLQIPPDICDKAAPATEPRQLELEPEERAPRTRT